MLEGFRGGNRWLLLALLFACHIFFLHIYRHFISPNELSRLLLTSAIVDDHTLSIDDAIRRYGNTQDKATFSGHYYSDKAIGTSILAIPAFLVMRAIESIANVRFSTPVALFWVRVFTVTIPALWFLQFLITFWKQLRPNSNVWPYFVFLHLFGTVAFTYSTLFVSHYLVGICLFASVFYLNEYRTSPQPVLKYALLSGMFAGLALLMEYPAIFPVAILCIAAIVTIRINTRLTIFAAPVAVAALIILGYNYAIFGTPWDVTYRHMTDSFHTSQHAKGFIGIGMPKPDAIYGLLLSRHHGLFFLSPFLALCLPGFYQMLRSPKDAWAGRLFLAITLATLLVYSGFSFWIAGWNFGPRYLTSLIPFLSTAAFYYADEFLQRRPIYRILFLSAAIWSVVCVTLGTITFPYPPDNLTDTVFFLNFPLLAQNATGKTWLGNAWFFFPLLVLTLLILVRDQVKTGRVSTVVAGSALAVFLLFVGFFSAPEPSAMEYYARGSVYLYLGRYTESFREMQRALAANPDVRSRALIERRKTDLTRFVKQ